MITTTRRVLDITVKEIDEKSDEFVEVYPGGCAVDDEKCIHSMQKHVNELV